MNPQDIANNFMAAYELDARYTFQFIKNECLFMFGDRKSYSVKACDWLLQDAEQMEEWIVCNVCAKLQAVGYPKAHTKAINNVIFEAVQEEIK